MRTLLGKKKVSLKEGIIILLVINFLIMGVVLLYSCGRKSPHEHKVVIDPKVKKFREYETLVFFRITDGKDTCLVLDFLDSFEERLNIKGLNQESFDANYSMKILNNEVIEVPEDYYREEKKYCVTPVEAVTALYNNYGIYNFVYYLDQYPINKLSKEDMASFYWAAYLLWQNGIYVSLAEEINYWYIDYSYKSTQIKNPTN